MLNSARKLINPCTNEEVGRLAGNFLIQCYNSVHPTGCDQPSKVNQNEDASDWLTGAIISKRSFIQ